MTRKTEADIEKWVSKGLYEDALGISVDATSAEVARAHIRQLHRFAHSEKTREALNHARTVLSGESIERKVQRLLNIDHLESALTIMKHAIDETATAYDHYMLGYILYRMDRYVESALAMQCAFNLSESPFHAIWLGFALERQGKMKQALEKYLWAIQRRGNETEHRLAGNIYFHQGDVKNACLHLEKAISMGCRDEDVVEKVLLLHQKQKFARLKMRLKNVFRMGRTGK